MRILVNRVKDSVEVLLFKNKEDHTYSYINLTKGHICPCRFNSIEEALDDLKTYKNVVSYQIMPMPF